MPEEDISNGKTVLQQAGRRFDFFITALNMINAISPASMYPEPVPKMKDKWKLSEDVVCLFSLSTWRCNVWRRKWYCLQQRLFWDRRIVILFQLSTLSQAASSYWCLFPQLSLWDIQFRDSRIPLLKVKPHIDNVNAVMTPTHPHTAFVCTELTSMGELVTLHAQPK